MSNQLSKIFPLSVLSIGFKYKVFQNISFRGKFIVRLILTKSPFQTTIIVSVMIFIILNTFLPLNFSLQTEAIRYPFKLTITLERSTYTLGEPVNVTWILTNIGEENATLYYSCERSLDFIILDENFNHVFWYGLHMGRFLVELPPLSIAPGDNITLVGVWSQIYDDIEVGFEVRPWVIKFKQVPPGTYYVFGIFESPTYNYTKLETPPLRITIIGT